MSHETILLFAVLFLFVAVAVLGVYVIKLLKWKRDSNYLPTLELHSDGEVWFKRKTLGGFSSTKILSYSDRIELLNRISNSKSEIGDALVQLATALGYERKTTAAQPEKVEWKPIEKLCKLCAMPFTRTSEDKITGAGFSNACDQCNENLKAVAPKPTSNNSPAPKKSKKK